MYNLTQDINKQLAIIDDAIIWAKRWEKENFPFEIFKEYRRTIKRIASALENNCSAAAYGESQVGKSYLMSSLLSSPTTPFVITNAGKSYSFIDDINPSGGETQKTESTGVVTRFTLQRNDNPRKGFVKVRNLSVVDIILLLVDSYYNDVDINPNSVLRYDDINASLQGISNLRTSENIVQTVISEDDIKDITDYIYDVIGNAAVGVIQSNFSRIVSPIIQSVPYDKWVDVFCLLWNKNQEISNLFSILINEYKKLNFNTEVYVPFCAVLRDKGTLLKVGWLDTVGGKQTDVNSDEIYTDVYDAQGNLLAKDFHKGNFSALIAEITFEVPDSLAQNRNFLENIDLLDFPGARAREDFSEQNLADVLPQILRRGKVAYLFNKYSRSLSISSVLYCQHGDQKNEPSISKTINNWIEENIGATPEERATFLNKTYGIAPLFLVATKFNVDLEKTKVDKPSASDKLDNHWKRFNIVLPEIVKPNTWMEKWVKPGGLFKSQAFQSIYLLRDFYWSGKCGVFDGYSDGEVKSEEKQVHEYDDYPNYFKDLEYSFLKNEFVKRHFANPQDSWNSVATINNDGSKAIIRNLNTIASVLPKVRMDNYFEQLKDIQQKMYNAMYVFFEEEDPEAKNEQIKQIITDIKTSLIFRVGENPEVFGHIIDNLMIPVGNLRDIAYDIIVCHTDTPKYFSPTQFICILADIKLNDTEEVKIKKLCTYLNCDEKRLEKLLEENGCTLENILYNRTDVLMTVAEVVTKHIVDYWNEYLNSQVKVLNPLLPHSENVVAMLSSLFEKMNIKNKLSERIGNYCKLFKKDELPNAIADFSALTLNNFVSSVGRNNITDKEVEDIKSKAEKCKITIDTSASNEGVNRDSQSLLDTLKAHDAASGDTTVSREVLMKLPFWYNYQRWENNVIIGLLLAKDISNVDPVANGQLKTILCKCEELLPII